MDHHHHHHHPGSCVVNEALKIRKMPSVLMIAKSQNSEAAICKCLKILKKRL